MHGNSHKIFRHPAANRTAKTFVRQYWTALVMLRNRERTEVADGRRLLRQMPPRSMRNEFLYLVRAKQENPEGQYSPRAPMTASATFAPRAGASSGFHRYANCKFPAPVLRACSSAHHTQEPEDVGGCRRSSLPVQPLPREAAPISALEFCGPQRYGCPLRFPGCIIFQCVRSNAPNPEFDVRTQLHRPDEIRYLLIVHQKCPLWGQQEVSGSIHNPEQG